MNRVIFYLKPKPEVLKNFLEDIELIIVDNISTLCRQAKENDADAWIPVQEWALQMRASKKSVLFIHHSGKGGNQRGTSKREDILDTVIALTPPENDNSKQGASFEVHFKKARGFFGDDAESFQAKLITDAAGKMRWESSAVSANMYDKVVNLLKEGRRQQEIAETLQ